MAFPGTTDRPPGGALTRSAAGQHTKRNSNHGQLWLPPPLCRHRCLGRALKKQQLWLRELNEPPA